MKMDKNVLLSKQKKVLKGFLSAWILTAAGIVGAGIAMLLTPMSVQTGSYVIVAAASAGGFLFGRAASSAVGKRGLLVGLLSGLILSLTLLAAYLLFFGMMTGSVDLLPLLFPTAASCAGGMAGVLRSGGGK